MKLATETFKVFCQITGFIAALLIYGMIFMAIGAVTQEWIGWLAYAVVTLGFISYTTAKERLGADY